jgi:hypothetical protein
MTQSIEATVAQTAPTTQTLAPSSTAEASEKSWQARHWTARRPAMFKLARRS